MFRTPSTGTWYQVLPGYHVPVLLSCILALPVRPLVAVAVLLYQLRYQGTRSIWYWYQAPGNNAGSKSGVTTEELPGTWYQHEHLLWLRMIILGTRRTRYLVPGTYQDQVPGTWYQYRKSHDQLMISHSQPLKDNSQ